MSVCMGLWTLDIYGLMIAQTEEMALCWSRIFQTGMFYIAPTYFHFLLNITKDKTRLNRKLLIISYLVASITFFSWFDRFKPVFRKYSWGYWPVAFEPIYFLLFLNSTFFLYYGLFFLYKKIKVIEFPAERTRLLYLFVGALIGVTSGVFSFLPNFGIGVYPFGPVGQVAYILILAYAIVRYRLMDITVALTRTGIFIAVYTLVLGLPFAIAGFYRDTLITILGPQWWAAPLGLMAALATVGPFIYIYLQRKAEDRLLKEQRRYQDTLKQASVGMTRIRNLRKLLELIVHIVTKTVKISYAAVYLYNEQSDEYVLQVSRDKGRLSIPSLKSDNPLITWITTERETLVYEEIKRQMQDSNDPNYKQLEENMRILTASVIIPSFLEDRFMGFIVLGDKISGQIYTPDDLNVFEVLASQAALAIENAQFYDEAKEMHEQIAQAEKMATIGTMADGLSHQINNRLYALSLIAGDTIDTIRMTDTEKCTSEVKEMIEQINHALERIQANVIQGGEVVRGLLKYSRQGEQGFDALDLNRIIDNTLEMVQYKVRLSELQIIRDFSADLPKIKGNLAQLVEVFFNFIDNAYDAIVERRTILKEEGYRGKITISAKPKDSFLEIIVEDNGMGIKDDNNKKLFTPFFTTKTSSRKGTGLGLYVIKRIITDSHQGKIIFESSHQIGTRFIVELPIAA